MWMIRLPSPSSAAWSGRPHIARDPNAHPLVPGAELALLSESKGWREPWDAVSHRVGREGGRREVEVGEEDRGLHAFLPIHWSKDYYFLKALSSFPGPLDDPLSFSYLVPSVGCSCFGRLPFAGLARRLDFPGARLEEQQWWQGGQLPKRNHWLN